MTKTYEVILEGQLGQRAGILSWTETEGQISGTFSLLGFDNPVTGTRTEMRLELIHNLRTAVSTLQCQTELVLEGGALSGTVQFQDGRMRIHGTKQNEHCARDSQISLAFGRKENI